MDSFKPIIILVILIIIGVCSHNLIFTLANLFLLIIRVTPMIIFFPWIEKNFLTLGVLFLTIGTMSPIASGRVSLQSIITTFVNWKSIIAIIIGIAVSLLGGKGLYLMSDYPSAISGLLIGTLIGVAFFGGVPVGPLIAAGLFSLIFNKI